MVRMGILVRFSAGAGTSLFSAALRPTQLLVQLAARVISLGCKVVGPRLVPLASHSAEVTNAWTYAFIHQRIFMAWWLIYDADNSTFVFEIAVNSADQSFPTRVPSNIFRGSA